MHTNFFNHTGNSITPHSQEDDSPRMLHYSSQISSPRLGQLMRILFIIYFAFHGLVVLLCVSAVLLLHIRAKKTGQRSILGWIVVKIYQAHKDEDAVPRSPLLLPNSGLVLTVAQIMESCLAEAFIAINFFTQSSSHFVLTSYYLLILDLGKLLQFYSAWILAWTLMFSRLFIDIAYSTRFTPSRRSFLGPVLLNTFFILFPILITGVVLGNTLQSVLFMNSRISEIKRMLMSENPGFIARNQLPFIELDRCIMFSAKTAGIYWCIVSTSSLIVYAVAFYKIQPSSLGQLKTREETTQCQLTVECLKDTSGPIDLQMKSLERGFATNLVVRSLLMVAALFTMLATSLAVTILPIHKMLGEHWVEVRFWLASVNGIMSSLACTYSCVGVPDLS